MDSGLHEVTKSGIDHSLAFDTALAGKGCTLDAQREVALAGWIVAAVAAVLLTFVNELDPGRRKSRVEASEHFSRNRSGSLGCH